MLTRIGFVLLVLLDLLPMVLYVGLGAVIVRVPIRLLCGESSLSNVLAVLITVCIVMHIKLKYDKDE